jgi:segregation and condensation protein A
MTYVVKLEQFEGPLDLLLYLIQREEMDIYDIPIARITDQYLKHIERMEQLDLNLAGDFLVMAATLLRIKARLLLPVQRPGEEAGEDPRVELVQRLLEYKKFKAAARALEERESERLQTFTRPLDAALVESAREQGDEEIFEVNVPQLMRALQGVLGRFETVVTHEVALIHVSLEEKTEWLRQQLQAQGRLRFGALFEGARSRLEVIVTFMALLELIKARVLRAHQAESFSELWIFPAAAGDAAAAAPGPEASP